MKTNEAPSSGLASPSGCRRAGLSDEHCVTPAGTVGPSRCLFWPHLFQVQGLKMREVASSEESNQV